MDACAFDFQLVDHLHLFLALVTHLHGPYHCLGVLTLGSLEFQHTIHHIFLLFSSLTTNLN